MQKIYTARDEMDAHFLQGLLEEQGLEVIIQGIALEGAWGNLPLSDTSLPTLWVKDEDLAVAKPIVDEYISHELEHAQNPEGDDDKPHGATWKCPKCGEEVELQFDECWNCGAEKPGTPA